MSIVNRKIDADGSGNDFTGLDMAGFLLPSGDYSGDPGPHVRQFDRMVKELVKIRLNGLIDDLQDPTILGPIYAAMLDKSNPIDADILTLIDSANSNALKKITFTELKAALSNPSGWTTLPACTFVSADLPTSTFVVNVTGDVTGYIRPSTKLKLTQGSNTLYFIVHVVGAYSGGVTPVTLFGGSSSTTVNIGASGMTSGSANLIVSSTTGFLAGMAIYGDGVPTGTTVLSVTDATHLVMSANATKTQSSVGTVTVIMPAYNLLPIPATNPITNPYYGQGKPQGFPADPTVWEIKITSALDCTMTSSTSNWFGDAALSSIAPSISVSAGIWDLSYEAAAYASTGTAAAMSTLLSLSTSSSSESDSELTNMIQLNSAMLIRQMLARKKTINLAAKTLYYLIVSTKNSGPGIGISGSSAKPTILRARSALL